MITWPVSPLSRPDGIQVPQRPFLLLPPLPSRTRRLRRRPFPKSFTPLRRPKCPNHALLILLTIQHLNFTNLPILNIMLSITLLRILRMHRGLRLRPLGRTLCRGQTKLSLPDCVISTSTTYCMCVRKMVLLVDDLGHGALFGSVHS